ncbi:helix-turn-helix domain-containing protein [Nonomuraea sp. NPDC046570]|uniref:TetR/AcrR family transcriptional regulator n=1 Tax=Nonomuraea sp. NPDC046570 TaxID=3155255 RepID=UPI0033D8697D
MPRNRQDIPRDERVSVILDVALRLFVDRDFDAVTMVDIARRANIRSGALYWYFKSKDHVLAAVLRRLGDEEVARLAQFPADVGPAVRLICYLTDLRPLRALHVAAHARMGGSEVVAAAHDSLIEQVRALTDAAIAGDVRFDRALAVDAVVAAFEGASIAADPSRSATDIVRFLLDQLLEAPLDSNSRA